MRINEKTERIISHFAAFCCSVCALAVKIISMQRVWIMALSFFPPTVCVKLLFAVSILCIKHFFLGGGWWWMTAQVRFPQKIVELVWQHRWNTANAMMCVSFWVSVEVTCWCVSPLKWGSHFQDGVCSFYIYMQKVERLELQRCVNVTGLALTSISC